MKDTEIVEVLADGTVYHFDMDVCNAAADQVFEQLWKLENTQLGYDYTATVYSVFSRAVHVLSQSGWSTNELIDTLLDHSDDEEDIDE
jgi:hypothetical protein